MFTARGTARKMSTDGVGCLRGPVPGVHEGQVGGAGQVDVAQPARRPGGGLVRVDGGGRPQQLADPVREPAGLHERGGLALDLGHLAGRNGDADGLDDVEESFPACRSGASTLAVSRAISRYASASRSASTACGSTASSSTDGRPGSSGTARHHATVPLRQLPETANRNYSVTSNNTPTLAK